MRVGGVAAPGGEDADGSAGRQYLLLDLADGQGHSAMANAMRRWLLDY